MRELAIRIDREQVGAGLRTVSSLRRLAQLYEQGSEFAPALDAWNEVLMGMAPGSTEWYEARYETLRLLLKVSPGEARSAYTQFRVLYPGKAPEPWGAKIEQLGIKELTAEELAAQGGSVQIGAQSGKSGGGK